MFPNIKNIIVLGSAVALMGFSAPCPTDSVGYTNAGNEVVFDALGPTDEWFSTEEEAVRFCPNQAVRSEGFSGKKWICHFNTKNFMIVNGHWVWLK